MNKQLITLASLAAAVIVLIGGILLFTQKANTPVATSSAATSSKKDFSHTALPQLTTTVAKNESLVVMHTTAGDIQIKLFNKYAPLAVENFIVHAKAGYYNGLKFHRVIKDFMIQGGDSKGDGSGGQSIWKGKDKSKDSGNGFKNEISDSLYNIRGALSMANAGADTNGSQFFINQNKDDQSKSLSTDNYPKKIIDAYKKGGNPNLDGSYTVFGQVLSGMDVVDNIANAKVKKSANGEDSTPVNPIKIKSITVEKEAK